MDTVKVAFRVDVGQSSPSSEFRQYTSSRTLENGTEDDRVTWLLPLAHAEARVNLYIHRAICHLEFNASRVVHGKSEALWSPDSLSDVVERLIDVVREDAWPVFIGRTNEGGIVWDDDWADQVGIRRLDVARNLSISDPSLVKRVLPSVVPSYLRHTNVYRDAQGGWTLVNGTKASGQDRMYDKGAELAAAGTENTLTQGSSSGLFRFETQLQKDRLGRYGLARLSDVTSETAWAALAARWRATNWGAPLPSPSGLLEALEGLPPLVLERLVGFLHLDAIGEAENIDTPSHVKKSRTLARQCGLTPGLPVEFLGKAQWFLSLDKGTLERISSVAGGERPPA